jgi:putative flavoprotein involved in K+ transport
MFTTHTLVIGAGQAGLATSRCLTDASIDHVVLERGRVADRWLGQTWESLRLLTPNWASRLPGWSYDGPQPDGFMTATEFAGYLAGYAGSFDAPVEEHSGVRSLRKADGGFMVDTDRGAWRAANVVIATGWCDQPRLPVFADQLPAGVAQFTPDAYRRPDELPAGRVLVVGGSATGVQLADELARAGREVILAVGKHSRLPRRYRGMDIWWWLDQTGTFAVTIDEVADPARARAEGALQLIGREDHRDVDLPALQRLGVQLAGHMVAVDGNRVRFATDLAASTAAADARLSRVLARIDAHIARSGLDAEVLHPSVPASVRPDERLTRLDLRRDGVGAVVWATGYRRPYPWLQVPVLDGAGEIRHRRGVTPVEGLYVMGQRFQYRRDSNFIDGVRHDAAYLAGHIADRAPRTPASARPTVHC